MHKKKGRWVGGAFKVQPISRYHQINNPDGNVSSRPAATIASCMSQPSSWRCIYLETPIQGPRLVRCPCSHHFNTGKVESQRLASTVGLNSTVWAPGTSALSLAFQQMDEVKLNLSVSRARSHGLGASRAALCAEQGAPAIIHPS